MGLLSQLGKDFVRSAVKQVGRDGGKIISNQVYGDAHSTPVRNVGEESAYSVSNQIQDIECAKEFHKEGILNLEERRNAELAGYFAKEKLNIFSGSIYIYFIICFFASAYYKVFCFICCFILLFRAWTKFYTKTRILSKPYRQMTYETDRRCKTGKRYAGDVIVYDNLMVEINGQEKKQIKNRLILYFVFIVLLLLAGSIRSFLSPYYQQIKQENEQQNVVQVDSVEDQQSDQESTNL